MKIAEMTAFHVRIPLRKPVRHASHARTSTDNVVVKCVLADGTTYPQKGSFYFADRQVDQKTGAIRLAGVFPNPGNVLRPGQYGRVRAVTSTKTDALLVPHYRSKAKTSSLPIPEGIRSSTVCKLNSLPIPGPTESLLSLGRKIWRRSEAWLRLSMKQCLLRNRLSISYDTFLRAKRCRFCPTC